MSAANEAMPVGPTADELAAQDGWTIENPQVRHDRKPDTFWLPGEDIRAAIGPGSQVRLLLWFIDNDAQDQLVAQCERMWALVEAREGDVIHGRLAAPPLSSRAALEMGRTDSVPTD